MSNAAQTFKNLLLEAIGHLQQLQQLLDDERQFLQVAQKDPAGLEQLTQQKNQVLALIQADVDQRCAFLEQQQLTVDQQGVDAFLDRQPEAVGKALRQGWNRLVLMLEKIQEENLKNGRILNRAAQHLDVLLNALKSSQASGKIYNPSGGAGGLNIPRKLGKA